MSDTKLSALTAASVQPDYYYGIQGGGTPASRKFNTIFVNVKDFGATGNGSTNDRTSIQAAMDWTSSNDRGIIFFPPGQYLIGSSLTFNPGSTGSITFMGCGKASLIEGSFADYLIKCGDGLSLNNPGGVSTAPDDPVMTGNIGTNQAHSPAHRVFVHNLSFLNSYAGSPAIDGGCIRLNGCSYGEVSHCEFDVSTGTVGVNSWNQCFGNHVHNCRFTGGGGTDPDTALGFGCFFMDHNAVTYSDFQNLQTAVRFFGMENTLHHLRLEVCDEGIAIGITPDGLIYTNASAFSCHDLAFESCNKGITVARATYGSISNVNLHGSSGTATGQLNYGIYVVSATSQIELSNIIVNASFTAPKTVAFDAAGIYFEDQSQSCIFRNVQVGNAGGTGWRMPPTSSNNSNLIIGDLCNVDSPTLTVADLAGVTPIQRGTRRFITDATTDTPTFGGSVTGGSTHKVPVFYDGSSWRAG